MAKEFHRGTKLFRPSFQWVIPSISHSLCLQPLLLRQPHLVDMSLAGSRIIESQRLTVNAAAQTDKQSVLIIELNRGNQVRQYQTLNVISKVINIPSECSPKLNTHRQQVRTPIVSTSLVKKVEQSTFKLSLICTFLLQINILLSLCFFLFFNNWRFYLLHDRSNKSHNLYNYLQYCTCHRQLGLENFQGPRSYLDV